MRFEAKRKENLVGFSSNKARAGETVEFVFRGTITTGDGERFFSCLEQFTNIIFQELPFDKRPQPSGIDHLVAILYKDGRCEVVINEYEIEMLTRVRKLIKAGEPVLTDAISDIAEVRLDGLAVPDDCGYFILISEPYGWRKGLAFDFGPLNQGTPTHKRSIGRDLAAIITELSFQSRHKLTEAEFARMVDEGWFPFIGLPESMVKKMVAQVKAEWPIDELLPEISKSVRDTLPRLRELLRTNPRLTEHEPFLEKALSHFEQGDHISAVPLLFARIEGILRRHYATFHGTAKAPEQKDYLPAVGENTTAPHEMSLLMPWHFAQYLTEAVFGWESFADPSRVQRLTKHSAGHGVAPVNAFDEKSSVLGILIVEHLVYAVLSNGPSTTSSES